MRHSFASFVARWSEPLVLVAAGGLAGGLLGCAGVYRTDPNLPTPGIVVPENFAAMRCPRHAVYTQGMTMGVQTAAYCEKPGGIKHGPFIEWYENRQKKSAGEYEEGHRQGVWTFFLPSGERESQITYDHGNVVSQTAAPAPPAQ